jgi:hypothetical protein
MTPLLSLLQAASQGRRDLMLTAFSEEHIHWAVETGLGALAEPHLRPMRDIDVLIDEADLPTGES